MIAKLFNRHKVSTPWNKILSCGNIYQAYMSQRGIERPLKLRVLDFFNLAMVELDVLENYMMKRKSEIEQE
jgi:hypothetical protein